MTGAQVNSKLERGLFWRYDIKQLRATPGWVPLQTPSDLTFANGVADSVSEQYHRIDAAWDATNSRLTLSLNPLGEGYWIPYVGNGTPNLQGVAQTALRGLGAYTPVIPAGISWVVTGPFSGCHSASFTVGVGKAFAHVITPAAGYTADTVNNQTANIAAQVGGALDAGSDLQVLGGAGEGYVFWTLIGATWYRRVIYAVAGTVSAVDAKSQV